MFIVINRNNENIRIYFFALLSLLVISIVIIIIVIIIITPRNSSYNESARAKQFPRAGEFNLGTILVPRCFAA